MKGVFLDFDSLSPSDLDSSGLTGSLPSWTLHPHTSLAERSQRIGDAEVVVVNKTLVDRELLEQCRHIQLIQVAATGYNNVDLAAATESGVAIANVRDYGHQSVAQHTFALILGLAGRLQQNLQQVRHGAWSASEQFCLLNHAGIELAGKALGIIGYGAIGQAVARIAQGFGLKVIVAESVAHSSNTGDETRVPLDALLGQADIVSLHCPLTSDNQHLINADTLGLMKPTAWLINTARGGLIDEMALSLALQQGTIAGAGLDVLSEEPPTGHNPLLQLQQPNLLVTPHCAWGSTEARQRLLDEMTKNIEAFKKGIERNRVV